LRDCAKFPLRQGDAQDEAPRRVQGRVVPAWSGP
jgi:hypothetical protein